MKKLLIIIFCILLLSSCSTNSGNKPEDKITETPTQSVTEPAIPLHELGIKDYYPYNENIRLEYVGKGNEYASRNVYVDFIKDDLIQLRVITGGTTSAQVLQTINGELRLLESRGEFYYRDNLIRNIKSKNYEVLLKEPLEEGTTWALDDGRKRYISKVDADVTTPSGEYKAVEVVTEGSDYKTFDYYVKGIGLVKSLFKTGESEIETSLSRIHSNTPVLQTIKFYYPDFSNEQIVYYKSRIELKTNDDISSIFEKYFKSPPSEKYNRTISQNTHINNLYLNDAEHKVYVDFSKELVTEMNAGSGLEGQIIQSIVNTLGDYYNVDKVYISVEGKPYESGHIAIKKGEVFYVDYKDVKEIK